MTAHFVAEPGDKRTLCGLKSGTVGVGWVAFARSAIDGYADAGRTFDICAGCEAAWMTDHDGWPLICGECDRPIVDDDRHTRKDGADVHGGCCLECA